MRPELLEMLTLRKSNKTVLRELGINEDAVIDEDSEDEDNTEDEVDEDENIQDEVSEDAIG